MSSTKNKKIRIIAKIAYDAYWAHTNGKSIVTGDDLPKWKDLPKNVKHAWFAVGEGIEYYFYVS